MDEFPQNNFFDDDVALDVLRGVLERDTLFTDSARPRENTLKNQVSRSDGAHVSHFVFYGLLGNSTGMPEYDTMFSELVTNLPQIPASVSIGNGGSAYSLPNVVTRHFAAYPDDIDRITPKGLAALREALDEYWPTDPELKRILFKD